MANSNTIAFPRRAPIMPFGPHAGATLDRLPDSELLSWLVLDRRPPVPAWLVAELDREWERRRFARRKAA